MSALLVGYPRMSADQQDLTSQRDGLAALGVAASRTRQRKSLPSPPQPPPNSANNPPRLAPRRTDVVD